MVRTVEKGTSRCARRSVPFGQSWRFGACTPLVELPSAHCTVSASGAEFCSDPAVPVTVML